MNALYIIQQKLNAPKGQFNKFGNYSYRNCEDILMAVKPLLEETNSTIILTDEIVLIGDRVYVKATATLTHYIQASGKATGSQLTYTATAFAREALVKKGMDESQITGAASSYARKYALNGLFLIDDNKDADSQKPEQPEQSTALNAKQIDALAELITQAKADIDGFNKYFTVKSLKDIPAARFVEASQMLEAKINRMEGEK